MIIEKAEHKSAINRFVELNEKKFLINPISELDLKIVLSLVELIKEKVDFGIVPIMNQYKLLKDKDTYNDLKSYIERIKLGKEKLEDLKLQYWIHFKDLKKNKVLRNNIIAFALHDEVDNPAIILNKCGKEMTKVPMHANELLEYGSENERDYDYALLDSLTNY